MHHDLTDKGTRALLNLLVETIEADRYPFSPRIRVLRAILAKDGVRGGQLAGIGQKQKDHQSPQGCRHRQAQPCPKEKKTKLM
jgi:hypothetical protein